MKSACELDLDSELLPGDMKISQSLPSKSEVAKIGNTLIHDSRGEAVPFSSLWTSRRAMIIFVRHFYCGNCQEYLRTLCEAITPTDLEDAPSPTDIVVIGCGSPELIDFYRQETDCTFPMYTDPERKLFKAFGMTKSKQMGQRPKYQQRSVLSISIESILQGLGRGKHALKGGEFWQLGGEFLIEDGECIWAHRMTTTRDHSEIPVIRKMIGLDGGVTPIRKRSSVIDGVKRRWSRQPSETSQGYHKTPHTPPSKIDEIDGGRDSGVEV